MATWIAHLRIAEMLLNELTELDPAMFVSGSIAPDCGLPNEDWSQFTPPKQITHFYVAPGEMHDMLFFREYLEGHLLAENTSRMSYLWGYFLHLVSDLLWYHRLASTTRSQYPALFAEKGEQAWWVVKEDWYDLDHKYLRDHPESLFWKTFINLRDPPQYVPFLPAEGIHIQFAHIRDYYGNARVQKGIDRPFPYLNETTMLRFIKNTVASLLKLWSTLQQPLSGKVGAISLNLLNPEEYGPIPPPLGDAE
ncbi:MAG: zinc dependent phospholipase C family protein [Anaerolineaceae bacterium]|nr:zinc dependent phospholipase C family protein [Anaerolineaceae bacterium]